MSLISYVPLWTIWTVTAEERYHARTLRKRKPLRSVHTPGDLFSTDPCLMHLKSFPFPYKTLDLTFVLALVQRDFIFCLSN